jgi:D-alanyl-D-alanine dipeptidase
MPNGIQVGDKKLAKVSVAKPASIPQKWEGLIGEYGWDHDIVYVFEKDNHINVLIEWIEFDQLQQDSENVFSFPKNGLYDGEKAVFLRDAKGEATQVKISGVVFKRRAIGGVSGGIFKIPTLRPVNELRAEALAAKPPVETGDLRKPDLVELTSLDPTIKLDIRYATKNNFLDEPVYKLARAYMERPAAEAVVRANHKLKDLGFGLLIHDSYRPWYVTRIFWDATPDNKKIFVADPSKGSRHNRGCAVDLTLYDLKTGKAIPMTGVYDEMSERSYPAYPGGTSLQRWHREILRKYMEDEGLWVYPFEWWHFDYQDWNKYPIINIRFEDLSANAATSKK